MLHPMLLALIAFSTPALSQTATFPPDVQGLIDDAVSLCDGTVTMPDEAVRSPDLNGDGRLDWIVDQSVLSCSTSATLYCGTQGCGVDTLIDGVRGALVLHSWEVLVEDGKTYLVAPDDTGKAVRFRWTGSEWEFLG